MSIQTKKGFTLIELMVVIVIIGILAAIAIPKLFGMSAKAKAQEVGPAVGTWTKLQLAYKMEAGDWGSAEKISYKLPGQATAGQENKQSATSNFAYALTGDQGGANTKPKFEATSKFDSDPCNSGGKWSAELGSYGETPEMKIAPPTGGTLVGCLSLTPNFLRIGCVTTAADDDKAPVCAGGEQE